MRLQLTGSATIILLLATAAFGADEGAKIDGETAHPEGDAIIRAAPHAARIEAIMVAPVKRETPKTPKIEMSGPDGASDSTTVTGKGSPSKTSQKVVGDRPNCDQGFKVDDSGTSCVKITNGNKQAKRRKR